MNRNAVHFHTTKAILMLEYLHLVDFIHDDLRQENNLIRKIGTLYLPILICLNSQVLYNSALYSSNYLLETRLVTQSHSLREIKSAIMHR